MVLYRMGREKDPATRLVLLYTLPSLAVNKVCNIHKNHKELRYAVFIFNRAIHQENILYNL